MSELDYLENETEQQRKEREHREDLERLRLLRPIDDDFMRCIFKDNIPLAQLTLRILTGLDDLVITRVVTQRDMKRLAGARSVCFDAYGTDTSGKKYDLEIQREDRGAGRHRARYHSSVMDVENLGAGQSFDELPDTYTIFITEHDVFGKGRPVYHVERMTLELGEMFDDGEHIMYANGEYRDDSDIGKLMHDFNCPNPNDMKLELFKDTAKYYKESELGVSTMCKVMEDMRDTARKEGMREGLKEGIIAGMQEKSVTVAKSLIKMGILSFEQIAQVSGLTLEQVIDISRT